MHPFPKDKAILHGLSGAENQSEQPIEELSADGSKIRIRTPVGEECRWLDYKGVRLHELATGACFQDNQQLIDWVRQQFVTLPLTCLGDGHDRVWNLIQPMAPDSQRREILDWYHKNGESREGWWFNATLESGKSFIVERQCRCHPGFV